jgi:mono/diheme cytochrome c family protein
MVKISCFKNPLMNGVIRMSGFGKATSPWWIRSLAICTFFSMLGFTGRRVMAQDENKPWVAPDDARKIKNPVPATPENLAAGAQLFKDNCVLCHGVQGKGDGIGAAGLPVKPANFTDAKLLSLETDGSLFWKMSEGRLPMPTWKDILSEQERWQLVNYIRKLNKDANAK